MSSPWADKALASEMHGPGRTAMVGPGGSASDGEINQARPCQETNCRRCLHNISGRRTTARSPRAFTSSNLSSQAQLSVSTLVLVVILHRSRRTPCSNRRLGTLRRYDATACVPAIV